MARNATAPFQGRAVTPEEVGRALGVSYVLEGSVRRAGDTIRVSARLSDAANGVHLWSDRFERQVADLFAMQDEITRNVAGALAVEITRVEGGRIADKPTANLEAYDLVTRGTSLLRRDERKAVLEARRLFESAIAIAPEYAAAYAGLGETNVMLVINGWTEFVPESLARAEALAWEALAIDTGSVEARRLLARLYIGRREHDLAAQELRRALEINPSDAESYKMYGTVLLWSGEEDLAIDWFESALRLDPNAESRVLTDVAVAYYLAGRYEEALATAVEARKRVPAFWSAPVIQAAAYAQLGRDEAAHEAAADTRLVRPFFSIDWYQSQFSDPEDAAHIGDGLRKAGLPESPTRNEP